MYRNLAGMEHVSFQRILEASLNEIYIFDPETLTFLFVNRGALLNLGYSPEEAARLTPLDLKPKYTEQEFRALIAPLLTDEQEKLVFETLHRRKDGTLYDVEVHLQRIRQQSTAYFVAIILDITERKRLEREREEALRLARAAAESKTRFLAHMSHEIRTPLNAVIGYAEALSHGLGRGDPGKTAEALDIISRAARELDTLISHILEYAREEAGIEQLSLEPVLISDLLRELDVIFHPLARQHRVSYTIDLKDEQPVMADPARLKSVILNLFSNAAKYGRVGGATRLELTRTEVGARLSVIDNGIGIGPEFQKTIFTPFSREGRASADTRGAGIGLMISRTNVERMGGTLGFTSALNQGSTFWIELGAAAEAA